MRTSSQGGSLSKVAVLFAPEFSSYAIFALCFLLYVDKMKISFLQAKWIQRKIWPKELKAEYHSSMFKYSDCLIILYLEVGLLLASPENKFSTCDTSW